VPEALITNPNDTKHEAAVARITREADKEDGLSMADGRKNVGHIAVKKYKTLYRDPDQELDKLYGHVNSRVVGVDAKILETVGRRGETKLVHYRNLQEYVRSPQVYRNLREHYSARQLKEVGERLVDYGKVSQYHKARGKKDFRESDFNMGLYSDEETGSRRSFKMHDTILPGLHSPAAKQQLLYDYLDAHRRCWEAATRNPLGKRIVKLIPQFVLGRGVSCRVNHQAGQAAWDAFSNANKLPLKSKTLLRELVTYGELFIRYFRLAEGLTFRSLDPSTIWDIITEPDDIETVRFYHQQYVLANTIVAPGIESVPATLIIRQIPAADIDHYKINALSTEKRGRSELYAVLGYLQRFRDFANDRVVLNRMRAMFALDVQVTGGPAEVAAAEEQFQTPPDTGSVLVHNQNVEVEFKNANNNANEAKTDADMLLRIIAIGSGVSEQFLGASSASTRAGALIQTEPDVKNFEDYQEIVEYVYHDMYARALGHAKVSVPTTTPFEVTFPSIASEDRSTKLKDLAMMEAMDWITKSRSATMAAKEMGVTKYNYEDEQQGIRRERAAKPLVMQGFQSLPKDGAAAEPALAGGGDAPALTDGEGGEPDDEQAVTQTSGQMGFSAKKLSGRNMADTKASLERSRFTRGSEMKSIKGRKSAGASVRASNSGTTPPQSGWTVQARMASLKARRRKRRDALMRERAAAVEAGKPKRLIEGFENRIRELDLLLESGE
jgi:hypothetical protein